MIGWVVALSACVWLFPEGNERLAMSQTGNEISRANLLSPQSTPKADEPAAQSRQWSSMEAVAWRESRNVRTGVQKWYRPREEFYRREHNTVGQLYVNANIHRSWCYSGGASADNGR
jgi:hypothetical protein